jgi:hypothetical protein
MPVPGNEAVPYTPRGPTFIVNGAPPMLQLRPVFDRLSFTPGMTLKECRNLHPIARSSENEQGKAAGSGLTLDIAGEAQEKGLTQQL